VLGEAYSLKMRTLKQGLLPDWAFLALMMLALITMLVAAVLLTELP
jgi:hypothetical protein